MPSHITTCDEAVRWFLSIAGCGDVKDIRMHTEHRWTEGEIRGALKRIGARAYKMQNGWETPTGRADGAYLGPFMQGPIKGIRRPTIYQLPA